MPHDHHHHDHQSTAHDGEFVELLDLEGAALHAYWADVLDRLHDLATPEAHTILDLGAGTGVGSLGLAERFPGAQVTAIDLDDASLARLREKAHEQGLDDRVHALMADLDHGLPDLSMIDVTWASMSMHHFGDPDQILRDVFARTAAGGIIGIAEFSEAPRMLPDSTSEQRWLDMLREEHRQAMPDIGADWSPRLIAAGFELVEEREIAIDVADQSPVVRRYTQLWLQRMLQRVHDRLDETERAELAALLADDGPESVLVRDDLHIRGTRTVTVGRRLES